MNQNYFKQMEPKRCQCEFCTNYDKYRWATIMECKCGCHESDKPIGHDGLCCEFPNGRKSENPYSDLKKASVYKEIIGEQ